MLPETRRQLILLATALFLLVAGIFWYLDLTRMGDIKQVENTVRAEYAAWASDLQQNYSCTRIDGGCVISGFFYKPCPTLGQGIATLNFTNKTA